MASLLDLTKNLFSQGSQRVQQSVNPILQRLQLPGPSQGQQRIATNSYNAVRAIPAAVRGFSNTTGTTDFLSGSLRNIVNTPRFLGNVISGQTKVVPSYQLPQYRRDPFQVAAQQGASRAFGSRITPQGNFQFTGTGVPRVALSGVGVLSGAALPAMVLGGAIGGGVAALDKRPIAQGIGEGAGQGLRTAGVTRLLAPVVNPVSRGLGSVVGQKLVGKGSRVVAGKLGQIVGNAVGQGLGNVTEDVVGNKLSGSRQNTGNENVGSFILGAFFGGADGLRDLNIDSGGFLRNKAGRMFDPFTGKFVAASQKAQNNQTQYVTMVAGNQVNMKAPTTWVKTPTGMKKVEKANSRLTQGGYVSLGPDISSLQSGGKSVKPGLQGRNISGDTGLVSLPRGQGVTGVIPTKIDSALQNSSINRTQLTGKQLSTPNAILNKRSQMLGLTGKDTSPVKRQEDFILKGDEENIMTPETAQVRAGEAYLGEMEGQKQFKESVAKWIGQRDVAKTIATQRAVKVAQIPKEIAWDVVRETEGTYKGSNPEVRKYAATLKKEYDTLFEEAKGSGVDIGYLKNYVTHIWAESVEQVEATFKSARGKFKYNKDRTLPTYDQGKQLGLTPKFNNPAEILQAYAENLEKAKANIAFLQDLKQQGLVVPASVARSNPGFKAITAPGIGTNETNIGGGRSFIGTYYAPDSVADTINRVFSEPPNDGFSKSMHLLGNLSGTLQDVTMSAGVPATPINAFTLANIQKEILAGRVNSPISSFLTALSPRKSQEFFTQNVETIKKMQLNNIPVSTSFKIENMVDSGTKKKLGWTQLMNDPTFERFIPQLQIRFFSDIEQQALKGGRSAVDAEKVAAQAVKNFYGVITSDKQALASRTGQDVTKTLFFAPKFRESMINFWVKNVKSLRNPMALENRANVKFLLGSAMTYAAMDGLNRAINGHPMSENPPGKEDKLLIPLDDGYTIGIPFLSSIGTVPRGIYRQGKALLSGDPQAAAKDAFSTYTSTLVKPLGEIASNQDYFGGKIYDPEATTGEKLASQGQHLIKSYNHPYIREALNVAGEKLPIEDKTKKKLGLSTGETPGYQTLSKAAELPIRFYKNESMQKQAEYVKESEIKKKQAEIKTQVLKDGKETTYRGRKYYLSKEMDPKTKITKPVVKSIKVSQTSEDIYRDTPKEYETSEDSPKNTLQKIAVYGSGILKDPKGTINAVKSGQPVRKVRGDAVVVERVKNLASMDQGNKATQVDHIIPIALGGDNRESNLAIIPKQDNQAKGIVDTYLADELEAGRVTKKAAQERIINWRNEINNLPASKKAQALKYLNTPIEAVPAKADTSKLTIVAKKEYEPIYNSDTEKYSNVSIKIPEQPKYTGQKELDSKLKSSYNSSLNTAKKNIEKLYLDGQLTAQEANDALSSIKVATSKPKIKKAKKPKKITIRMPKIKAIKIKAFKPIKIKKPKKLKFKKYKPKKITY